MGWDIHRVGRFTVTTGVVVLGVLGAVALVQPTGDAESEASSVVSVTTVVAEPSVPPVDLKSRVLTMDIAKWVWDESQAALETRDPARYEATTCGLYIGDQMTLRKVGSTAELLDAFAESEKYRPPWKIQDTTLVAVEHEEGNFGWLRTTATVTDYRLVPPTSDRREINYNMIRNEDNRWKLCPVMTPIG